MSRQAQIAGKRFENLIEYANRLYESKGVALVHKREIPFVIEKRLPGGKVVGHLTSSSQSDYEGIIFGGRSIQFEAKSTALETRFNLSDIKEHQVEYLEQAREMGALSFVLVEFQTLREVYLLPAWNVARLYREWRPKGRLVSGAGRASIPIEYFREKGKLVESNVGTPLDYIKAASELRI